MTLLNVDVSETADQLMSRALGRAHTSIDQLLEELEQNGQRSLDYDLASLLNHRSVLYSRTKKQGDVERAMRIVELLSQRKSPGLGEQETQLFPNLMAVNAVLQAMTGPLAKVENLDFAMRLLDALMRQENRRLWPDNQVFRRMFNLLTACSPEDIGERADILLSKAETRRFISQAPDDFVLGMSIYRQHMACWKMAAEKSKPRKAAARALASYQRLESLSQPVLLSPRMLQGTKYEFLYEPHLTPARKQMRSMILHSCAVTSHPEELELAARVATEVLDLLLLEQREKTISSSDILYASQCLARLEDEEHYGSQARIDLERRIDAARQRNESLQLAA